MKKILLIALCAIALASCNNAPKLTTLTNGQTILDSANTTIKVNYPIAANQDYPAVADSINAFVKSLLDMMPDAAEPSTIFQGDTINFPLEKYMNWSANINDKIVQLEIEQYLFTGGAHGLTTIITRTFNAKTGQAIDPANLVTHKQQMLDIIAEQLIADSIPLLISPADVPMPETFAIDSTAVTAIYNQYEIAPYSSGIIKIRMPYTQLENIFDTTVIEPSTLSTVKCPID